MGAVAGGRPGRPFGRVLVRGGSAADRFEAEAPVIRVSGLPRSFAWTSRLAVFHGACSAGGVRRSPAALFARAESRRDGDHLWPRSNNSGASRSCMFYAIDHKLPTGSSLAGRLTVWRWWRVSPRRSDSRERMILSAAALLREYGASATSVDRVLAHSGAPRGSVYHHFPGGRAQLIDEAVALAGDFIAGLIDAAMQADDPVEAVDAFFVLWRDRLVESGFRAGCPIVAVAVETNDDAPQLARSAAAVFARWQEALAGLFLRHGLTEERSRRLGAFVIAAVEGAVIMCRAEQSTAPIEAAAAEIHDLLLHALRNRPEAGPRPGA